MEEFEKWEACKATLYYEIKLKVLAQLPEKISCILSTDTKIVCIKIFFINERDPS